VAKQTIVVPDIGGAEGAEVIEMLVAVGDEISLEQILIVLESDKASMEIPSTLAGTVVEVLAEIGQELAEGDPIVLLEAAGDGESDDTPEDSAEETPGVVPEVAAGDPAAGDPAAGDPAAGDPAAGAPAAKVTPPVSAASERAVTVPDIGTDDPVEIIELCVAVGDVVAEGDSLVVLESDKASMEVPSPFAGEVLNILVTVGDEVKTGDNLMGLKSDVVESAPAESPVQASTPEPSAEKNAVPAAVEAGFKSAGASPDSVTASDEKSVHAGPAVRKLAREFGLELAKVTGTGPRGRLLKEDLHGFVKNALSGAAVTATSGSGIPPIPEVDFSAFGEVAVEPLSKMGKLVAANMQRSWLNVPHVTQFDDADITDLEAFRADLKAEGEKRGVKLTPLPFLLKACAVTLRDNPKFRSSLTVDGQSLVYKQYTHIGMAVDTPAGLLVPVIRDVDTKTIWELAEEVVSIAGQARDRKLTPAQMQGGCFTISSLGSIGGTGFTPIVNAPEVGILGVSKASIQPVWDGAEFQPRKLLPLALSYDHRVINGGDAGRFFTQLVSLLSDIRRLAL
jgi:pyruvate dehydrogenase E2 component (dihydrolipoamide acetyltransferase)